jgi:hypothetical protein
MSKYETPMTRWFWEQIGGTLIEEFRIVSKTEKQGLRLIDGLIILDEKTEIMEKCSEIDISGKDVCVVQTKNDRLGMSLMGQALFSLQVIKNNFNPRRVYSVALCTKSDATMEPLLTAFKDCHVVVYGQESLPDFDRT